VTTVVRLRRLHSRQPPAGFRDALAPVGAGAVIEPPGEPVTVEEEELRGLVMSIT
jgi:hypothetical protein